MKNEERRYYDKSESHAMVPFELVAEIKDRKHREDRKRDDLLNRLQLRGVELVGADAVRRHLKTVFEEGNAPAHQDRFPECFVPVFQVPVPGEGHEDVGNREQYDGSHSI